MQLTICFPTVCIKGNYQEWTILHFKTRNVESSFIFDILYKQIDVVSMGLPLGPILANAITKNFGVVIVHQHLNLLKFKDHSFSFARYKQKKL